MDSWNASALRSQRASYFRRLVDHDWLSCNQFGMRNRFLVPSVVAMLSVSSCSMAPNEAKARRIEANRGDLQRSAEESQRAANFEKQGFNERDSRAMAETERKVSNGR